MACRTIKDPVTGQDILSKAWDSIYKIVNNEQEADRLYNKILSTDFINQYGDWIGESKSEPGILSDGNSIYINTPEGRYSILSDNIYQDPSSEEKTIPFRYDRNILNKGGYVFLIRDYPMGTYKDKVSGDQVNVFPQGKTTLNEFLLMTGLNKKDFKKLYMSGVHKDQVHMNKFLDGDSILHLHRLEKVRSKDDILPDIDDSRFSKVYDSKISIIRKLRNELKKTRDPDKKEIIRDRIKSLEKQTLLLEKEDSRTLATILDIIENDLEAVRKTLEGNPDRPSLEYSKGLIYNYVNLLSQDFGENIEYLDDEVKMRAYKFITEANTLGEKIEQKFFEKANEKVVQYTGKSVMLEDVIVRARDINNPALYSKDSTENPNPIVQTLTKIIKDANRRLAVRYEEFLAKNSQIVSELKKFQKDKGIKDIYDFMIQEINGKRTGYFVSENSPEYTAAKSNAKLNPKDEFEFMRDNHKFTVQTDAWTKRKERLINYYENNFSDSVKYTDEDERRGITFDQKLRKYANRWANKVNPNTMLSIFNKDPKNITPMDIASFIDFTERGGFKAERIGNDYVHPLETKTDSKWQDKKYKEIQAMSKDDPRRKFYEHFTKKIYEGNRLLQDENMFLSWNYIPEKTKDLGVVGNVRQWVTDNVSQKISQNIHGVDLVTDEIEKNIPLYMNSTKLTPEEKSYDLGDVLKDFERELINYKEKSEIEDDSNLLLYLLSKQEVYETNPDGTPKTVNGKIRVKKGLSNNFLMAQYRLNAQLYDEKQDKEVITDIKLRDEIVRKRLKVIKDKIDKLNISENDKAEALEYVTSEVEYQGDNDKIEQYITLSNEYKMKASNFKYVTGNKVMNSLIYYTSVKLLGLNMFGSFAELLQGAFSLFTESGSRRYFNDSHAAKGMGRVMRISTPWSSPEKDRVVRLSKLFDAQGKVFQDAEQDNIVSKVAFWTWDKANFLMNNSFLFAMLEKEQVIDKKGKSHSLADALQVDEDMKMSWSVDADSKFELYDTEGNLSPYILSLMLKFKEVLKNNRERQTFDDPIKMEETVIGRMTGQFKKSWLFRAFYSRFGDERELDLFSGGPQKGFYRSWFELFRPEERTNSITGEVEKDLTLSGFLKIGKKLLVNWVKFSKIGDITGNKPEGFSELDETNLRKFMRELSLAFSVAIVLIILTSGGDDDRDPTRTYAINQLIRLKRDLSTYMSPASLASIVKNPFPVMSTVTDGFKVIDASIQSSLLMDPYINKGRKNQELRVIREVRRNVPFWTQIDKTLNKFNKKMNYEY